MVEPLSCDGLKMGLDGDDAGHPFQQTSSNVCYFMMSRKWVTACDAGQSMDNGEGCCTGTGRRHSCWFPSIPESQTIMKLRFGQVESMGFKGPQCSSQDFFIERGEGASAVVICC